MENFLLNLDFAEASNTSSGFVFPYNVYKSVDVATGGFVTNIGSDKFAPFRAIKNNGYYRLEFMGNSTSMYVTEAAPDMITTTQPG